QPVAAIRAMLQPFEIDVVPAHAHGGRALADLAHQVARETLLDVHPDVAVGRLAHEGRDVVEQSLRDRRCRGHQPHVALHAAASGLWRAWRIGPTVPSRIGSPGLPKYLWRLCAESLT